MRRNRVIIDILERLINEIKLHSSMSQYHTKDEYIVWVEGVIEGLKLTEGDKTKHNGGMADDGR